ncbi:hypothetical protein ACHQM5_002863 [Ranunculus cassubicifolius]
MTKPTLIIMLLIVTYTGLMINYQVIAQKVCPEKLFVSPTCKNEDCMSRCKAKYKNNIMSIGQCDTYNDGILKCWCTYPC